MVNRLGLVLAVLGAVPIGLLTVSYEESFLGIALATFWGFLFVLALYRFGKGTLQERWLRIVVAGGLLIRIPMVMAHLAVGFLIYGGQVDFPTYFNRAVEYGESLVATGNVGVFLDFMQPGELVISRLLVLAYLLIGPSLVGVFLLSGLVGFWGSYLFLRAFQTAFPSFRGSKFLAVSLFFLPSLAFWTSLLGKDSWLFFFLGWATYAVANIVNGIRLRHLLGLLISTVFITLIRPPIGVALTMAVGGALILGLPSLLRSDRPAAVLRPVAYVLFGFIAVGGVGVAATSLRSDPRFSDQSSLAEGLLTIAIGRHGGLSTEAARGGSSLAVQITDPTPGEVARFLPQAMFTFLFRPLIFEAHNVLGLIAALDGTLLLVIVLSRGRYLLRAIGSVLTQPFVAFCLVAFLFFTAGLSFESNFGAIVRHRSMVLPFLLILLSVPRAREAPSGVEGDGRLLASSIPAPAEFEP